MAKKQPTSPLIWAFLLLLLASFVALILFLDQRIVKSGGGDQEQASTSGQEQKPIIDFYDVLPKRELEITISEEDREGIENPSINKQASTRAMLQVGSFQSPADADSLKARLALLGLEARIQTAELNNGTWHRVQLGPFASNTKLSRAKNLLIENKIDYVERSLAE